MFILVFVRLSGLRQCLLLSVLLLGGVAPTLGFPADVKSLLDQARVYEKASDYAGAERSYRQALALAPDDPEVLKRLGILCQTELKFQESIELFQRALSRSAQYPEVNFFLGASYLGSNQFQKATESFKAELSTPNPHPRCHYYYAIGLVSLGRPDDAIAQFNQSLARNPKDADALYQLARLHMNAALEIIQGLTDIDPDSFQLHALMGEIYASNKLYEDSLKEYRAALVKRPDAPGLHYALGVAYRNLKQIDEAEKEFLQALREDPNDFRVNLYLGEFAVGRGNCAGAMDYLRVASAAQPGAGRPHFLLGKCYRSLKDLEKAKSELLIALSAEPNDQQIHFQLAGVYKELGDTKASAQELKEVQRLSAAEKEKTYERARTTPQ
jgi:protein O-GlcNAc transferase